jgi:pimeloyl-ACP methyl ester carboxylesterase
MKRRELFRIVGTAGLAAALPNSLWTRVMAQGVVRFEVHGSGPAVILGPPVRTSHIDPLDPQGQSAKIRAAYLTRLTDRYKVIVMDYPPVTGEALKEVVSSFTVDRVCSDILGVADSAGADRFAWCGFSFGGGVGLQLAARTNRLSALICGSWSPLGWPYPTMPGVYAAAPQDLGKSLFTYFKSIENWPERDAVSKLSCPRLVLAGATDTATAFGVTVKIAEIIQAHRAELERLGWRVRLVDGFGHELGSRPEVAAPLVREFLDATVK